MARCHSVLDLLSSLANVGFLSAHMDPGLLLGLHLNGLDSEQLLSTPIHVQEGRLLSPVYACAGTQVPR